MKKDSVIEFEKKYGKVIVNTLFDMDIDKLFKYEHSITCLPVKERMVISACLRHIQGQLKENQENAHVKESAPKIEFYSLNDAYDIALRLARNTETNQIIMTDGTKFAVCKCPSKVMGYLQSCGLWIYCKIHPFDERY